MITDEALLKHIIAGLKSILHHESGVTHKEFKLFLDIFSKIQAFAKDADLARELVTVLSTQAGLLKENEVCLLHACLHSLFPGR